MFCTKWRFGFMPLDARACWCSKQCTDIRLVFQPSLLSILATGTFGLLWNTSRFKMDHIKCCSVFMVHSCGTVWGKTCKIFMVTGKSQALPLIPADDYMWYRLNSFNIHNCCFCGLPWHLEHLYSCQHGMYKNFSDPLHFFIRTKFHLWPSVWPPSKAQLNFVQC